MDSASTAVRSVWSLPEKSRFRSTLSTSSTALMLLGRMDLQPFLSRAARSVMIIRTAPRAKARATWLLVTLLSRTLMARMALSLPRARTSCRITAAVTRLLGRIRPRKARRSPVGTRTLRSRLLALQAMSRALLMPSLSTSLICCSTRAAR